MTSCRIHQNMHYKINDLFLLQSPYSTELCPWRIRVMKNWGSSEFKQGLLLSSIALLKKLTIHWCFFRKPLKKKSPYLIIPVWYCVAHKQSKGQNYNEILTIEEKELTPPYMVVDHLTSVCQWAQFYRYYCEIKVNWSEKFSTAHLEQKKCMQCLKLQCTKKGFSDGDVIFRNWMGATVSKVQHSKTSWSHSYIKNKSY